MTVRMREAWRFAIKTMAAVIPIVVLCAFIAIICKFLVIKILFWYYAIATFGLMLLLDHFVIVEELKDTEKINTEISDSIKFMREWVVGNEEEKITFKMIFPEENSYELYHLKEEYFFLKQDVWKKFLGWYFENIYEERKRVHRISFCIPEEEVDFNALKKYKSIQFENCKNYIFL